MSLNDTPSGDRIHVGFFGRRNAGKSSLVNAVTGQELAVVSEIKGTTTDPVTKAMELLPLGPVTIIDTPGFDDEGSLGEKRVHRTRQVLCRTDVAVLVVDGRAGLQDCDRQLIGLFREKNIPYVVAWNKCDLAEGQECPPEALAVSAATGENIYALKERIAALGRDQESCFQLVGDLVQPGALAVLVIPIDKAAPKGRLILPQQQVIRDLLDAGAAAVCTRETELRQTLRKLGEKPGIVITDSQVFAKAAQETPEDVPLTSFSILMARKKGLLEEAVRGAAAIETLRDGDKVLISEGCTHHRQCDDIGTVKLPRWLGDYTGKQLEIATSSGKGFPEDLSPYRLVIHCGGCMLNEREVRSRMRSARDQGIPITNYGTAIAYMQGILPRSIAMFPGLLAELKGKAGSRCGS